ncbi:MAG: MFS transporter, partial [Chloroflexi bacterium]|nr:MFS transporter [Chloroflexota bacterium]
LRAMGSSVAHDFTLREALREPSFWWLSFGHGAALFVVGAVNVHMVSHLNESLGYSLGAASGVYSAVTLLFMFGTLAGGWIGDHHSKRLMAFGCMGMHAVGMVLLSHAQNFAMVVAFVLLHGLAWGMRGPQMAALRADYFGRASFGTIMGISNMIVILGAIAGPLIAGYLYDQTGNYRIGFDILAACSAVGSVFFALARRPAPRPTPMTDDTATDGAPGVTADASEASGPPDHTEPPQAA